MFRNLLVFLLIIVSPVSQANDTAFGGSGSLPIPIKKTDIQMVKEHIRILGKDLDHPNMQGEWQISCDFTFRNTSTKPITLNVGFPFPVYEAADSNITLPANKQVILGDPLVHDFKVTIDGKLVNAVKQKINYNQEQGLYYDHAYLWKMNFAPQQIVNVHHDYVTGITFNVMGYTMVDYVLKTGVMWQQGKIGNTFIELIPNTPTRLCSEIDTHSDYLQPKPNGVKILGDGAARKYVWNLKNFEPKDDLNVCLMTAKNYVRYTIVYPIINQMGDKPTDLKTKNMTALRLLRNTIFAQYGKTFVDQDLQNYFNQQWWYQPNPHYSNSLLTTEDKKALRLIVEAEKNQN